MYRFAMPLQLIRRARHGRIGAVTRSMRAARRLVRCGVAAVAVLTLSLESAANSGPEGTHFGSVYGIWRLFLVRRRALHQRAVARTGYHLYVGPGGSRNLDRGFGRTRSGIHPTWRNRVPGAETLLDVLRLLERCRSSLPVAKPWTGAARRRGVHVDGSSR